MIKGSRLGNGRFTLKRELGKGGMGAVWLALDEEVQENVALKLVSGEIGADSASLKDLQREVRKIDKADGQTDWTQPVVRIERQIRALTPWPGAFTSLPTEKQCRLKITEAILAEGSGPTGVVLDAGPPGIVIACGEDALSLKTIQREGAKKMTAAEFLRGFNLEAGAMMGGTSSVSSQE